MVLLVAVGVTAVLLPSGHPRHRPTAVTSTSARPANPVTSAPSRSIGWQCGPEMTLGHSAHTLRACIKTDGTHLYLKGFLSPVPEHVNEKIILVVKDPDQQDAARYTSPECKAGECTFQVTAKVGRGTYSCLPQWAHLDKYQGTGRESPFVTF
ncbi:MAG: hypothetical protein ACJ72W_26865 [Actinoallomurus sp.]